MDDIALPQRSDDALGALDIFYDEFNQVHFFVEDEDQENLYEVILRKIFPELRISRIFPLGGKQKLLTHMRETPHTPGSPKSVYIVDKDFDDFLGKIIAEESLFYLDRYCIENYLLEPTAIIDVVIESLPKTKRQDIVRKANLQVTLHELSQSLVALFQLFYCVQRFNLGIKNTSLPAECFCHEKQRWMISPEAIKRYTEDVIEAAALTEHADMLRAPLQHAEVTTLLESDRHAIVSGKHIATLLFHYLKHKFALGSITFDSFIFRLAKNSSLRDLNSLAESIREFLLPTEHRRASRSPTEETCSAAVST